MTWRWPQTASRISSRVNAWPGLRASSASTANAFGSSGIFGAADEQAMAGQVDFDLVEHDPAGCRLVFCHALLLPHESPIPEHYLKSTTCEKSASDLSISQAFPRSAPSTFLKPRPASGANLWSPAQRCVDPPNQPEIRHEHSTPQLAVLTFAAANVHAAGPRCADRTGIDHRDTTTRASSSIAATNTCRPCVRSANVLETNNASRIYAERERLVAHRASRMPARCLPAWRSCAMRPLQRRRWRWPTFRSLRESR